jgi:hypothetical protein
MPDIFVSYSHKDKERVRPIVEELAKHGWSLFWDMDIPAGRTWHNYIAEALKNSRCVLVVWSHHSIDSDSVIEEAQIAKTRGILVPLCIDDVDLPLGFSLIQAPNIFGWNNKSTHPAFQQTIAAIELKLSSSPQPARASKPAKETVVASTIFAAELQNFRLEPQPQRQSEGNLLSNKRIQQAIISFAALIVVMLVAVGSLRSQPTLPPQVPVTKALSTPPSTTTTLKIGDAYGGGIVFYVDAIGKHGLIAAKSDIATTYTDEWDGRSYTGAYSWSTNQYNTENGSDYAYQKVSNTNTAIGQGADNTRKILTKYPAIIYPHSAAAVASGYRGGGYSDWFLPSKDELKKLYDVKSAVGSFLDDSDYWSSSERSAINVWYRCIGSGSQDYYGKDGKGRVRPVRVF